MRGEEPDVPEMTVAQLKTHGRAHFGRSTTTRNVDTHFARVGEQFKAVDKHFAQVDQRFKEVSEDLKRHTTVMFESLRDDIHKIADGLGALTNEVTISNRRHRAAQDRLAARLDDHEARIGRLESRPRRSRR